MHPFRLVAIALLSLSIAAPAFAKSVSRARLITWPNPSKAGETVVLLAEIDGLGGGAPQGRVTFSENGAVLGSRGLTPYGAGQATLAAGISHSCALTAAGGVACWGAGGLVGDGTSMERLAPAGASGLASDVAAVAAGFYHSCALTRAGSVKCWGDNSGAQLGDGTDAHRYAPVDVVGLRGGIVGVTAGRKHSCALTRYGSVKCWGLNNFGQIGIEPDYPVAPTPVAVPALSSGIVAIAAGESHSCALTKGGHVRCWGDNSSGQLGMGYAVGFAFTPVTVPLGGSAVAIAAGGGHTCALISSGAVECWGEYFSPKPVAISGLSSDIVAIATVSRGESPGFFALSKTGAVKGIDRSTSKWVALPSLSSGVVAIAGGGNHYCALTRDGATKCWGVNRYGQLGDGTRTDRNTPVTVAGFSALVRSRTWISTRTLGSGVHPLRASYPGDSLHGGSSGTLAQTVE